MIAYRYVVSGSTNIAKPRMHSMAGLAEFNEISRIGSRSEEGMLNMCCVLKLETDLCVCVCRMGSRAVTGRAQSYTK